MVLDDWTDAMMDTSRMRGSTKASMTSMRGRVFEFRGIRLIPTYHPAALLRNPGLKREAWADLQQVRELLHAGGPS